uniref:Uncharacterized protein n=1 Tax=Bacteriophage sp. TaxID=38018 RepID=A0A8D9UHV0_9VIRU|nr:MAG TPA: hypothetical protein [Bacteriophage sp.]
MIIFIRFNINIWLNKQLMVRISVPIRGHNFKTVISHTCATNNPINS